MKKHMSKVTALLLLFAVVFLLSSGSSFISNASKKPRSNDIAIVTIDKGGSLTYLYSSKASRQSNRYSKKISKVKGISYDKKTNTLTLNNFKKPNVNLTVHGMGTGFKIKLIGNNKLKYISLMAGVPKDQLLKDRNPYTMTPMTVKFTGKGKLSLSSNDVLLGAIYGYAVSVVFDKKVSISTNNIENGAIRMEHVVSGDGITIKGKCNQPVECTEQDGIWGKDKIYVIKGAVNIKKK